MSSSEIAGRACAVHFGSPASFVCSRCGAFACEACAVRDSSLCEKCAARIRKPRSAWEAGLLAAICPGLGLVYVGRMRAALAVMLSTFFVPLAVVAFGAHHPAWLFRAMVSFVLEYVGLWAAQLVWSVVLARRYGANYLLRAYNGSPVYITFFVASFVVSNATARIGRSEFVEPFHIPSGAMTPSVLGGDNVYAVNVDRSEDRKRGDILVFKNPEKPGATFIMRMVGLPGDRIALSDGQLRLNGTLVVRTLVVQDFKYWSSNDPGPATRITADLFEENLDGRRHSILHATDLCAGRDAPTCTYERGREFAVPAGKYFMMGDNREQAADSRFGFGTGSKLVFVPEENVIGRAAVIWFSYSRQDGIRWDRLGRMLQ